MEKKTLPEELASVLSAEVVRERPIRLMFQDEARFGRMARIRRCWAPAPLRPVVCNGYEREFTYVYGSVSPRSEERRVGKECKSRWCAAASRKGRRGGRGSEND